MEFSRYYYIIILAVFVVSGRKFLDAWRNETPRGRILRYVFGTLCLVCFLIVAFFEVQV